MKQDLFHFNGEIDSQSKLMARSILLQLVRSQATYNRTSSKFLTGFYPHASGRCLAQKSQTTTHNFHPAKHLSFIQRTYASQPALNEDNKITIGPPKGLDSEKDNKDSGVVYHGPISNTIKKVKLLSLSTCCLSVSLGPVITFMTSPDMNVILKGAVASSVIFLSASTTLALHWFVSPYIHKLRWQPGSDSFEADMMTWLATFVTKTIKFSDIRLPETNRPFVTFKANGEFYFVDADHCHNKALLARLTPTTKSTPDSALKNL